MSILCMHVWNFDESQSRNDHGLEDSSIFWLGLQRYSSTFYSTLFSTSLVLSYEETKTQKLTRCWVSQEMECGIGTGEELILYLTENSTKNNVPYLPFFWDSRTQPPYGNAFILVFVVLEQCRKFRFFLANFYTYLCISLYLSTYERFM